MKVYALYECHYDYCENWVSIINLYAKREDAEAELSKLESVKHDPEKDSWYVSELEVI